MEHDDDNLFDNNNQMTNQYIIINVLILLISFHFVPLDISLADADLSAASSVGEQIANILLTSTRSPQYDSTSASGSSTSTTSAPPQDQVDHHIPSSNDSELSNLSKSESSNETSDLERHTFIHHVAPAASINNSVVKRHRSKNYASSECAKVIESNPEAKKSSYIINEMIDEYMLNPCKTKIWFVIELCEIIQASQIEIASYELYSSTPKDFTVYFSDTYPASDWKPIGNFTASDSRSLQTFDLDQLGFGKFIRVELNSHYGTEHYCVISEVKVYGASMVEEYEKFENNPENGEKESTDGTATRHITRKVRKTSAYRVYRNMMVNNPNICGQSFSMTDTSLVTTNNETTNQGQFDRKEPMIKPILPSQPTQQPILNKTSPLKPSIFVELSNKLKALELSLKTHIEDVEKRLNDKIELEKQTEAKVDRLKTKFESFAFVMITYYVYKVMVDLM